MTFFNKLKTFAAGTSHDILDRVIDNNNPTMLRQYARDLEEQKEVLVGESATAAGQVRTLTRERDAVNANIESIKAKGTQWKNSNDPQKDAKMQDCATQIVQLRVVLTTKQQALDIATTASAQLDIVVSKVTAKSNEINARINALTSMDSASKAKAHAADIISQTASLLDNTGTDSIDNLESKIRAKNDVADVKLERAMGNFNDNNPGPDAIAVSSVVSEF